MRKFHEVQAQAEAEGLRLVVDGKTYLARWENCSPRLAQASLAQQQHLDIAPSGYGISWPDIDEDLTLNWLMQRTMERLAAPFWRVMVARQPSASSCLYRRASQEARRFVFS